MNADEVREAVRSALNDVYADIVGGDWERNQDRSVDRLLALLAPSVGEPVRDPYKITHEQGIRWFEETFGVPLGDMPGRRDVDRVKAEAALCAPASAHQNILRTSAA